MKNTKILLLLLFVINFSYASFFSSDTNMQKEFQHYKNTVNLNIKEKINKIFNDFQNQSMVEDKNIQYYRPDVIYRRPPRVFRIWTRASVTSIDNGKYYYIIPEGYRIIYEKEGELYIDYDPTKQKVPLNILQMNNY